jgi:hypothetical protein
VRLARVFVVLEMTAGEHEADPARPVPVLSINDDAAVDRFREDAREGLHLELVVIGNTSPIGKFDGLDSHLQERACPCDLKLGSRRRTGFGGRTLMCDTSVARDIPVLVAECSEMNSTTYVHSPSNVNREFPLS